MVTFSLNAKSSLYSFLNDVLTLLRDLSSKGDAFDYIQDIQNSQYYESSPNCFFFFFFDLCSEELTAVTSHLKVFQLKNTLNEQQVKCFCLGVDQRGSSCNCEEIQFLVKQLFTMWDGLDACYLFQCVDSPLMAQVQLQH